MNSQRLDERIRTDEHKLVLLVELKTEMKWLVKGLDRLTEEVYAIREQLTSGHIRMDRHEGLIQRALETGQSSKRSSGFVLWRLLTDIMSPRQWLLGFVVVVTSLIGLKMPAEVKALILALLGSGSG